MGDELRIDTVRELLERQRKFTLDPWEIYPIFLRPCRVRILMVTDGSGSFGLANFGLKALIDALSVSHGPWVRFSVTTAHRRSEATASISNFRFDQHDLGQFDQIWMIGVENRFGSGLSQSELRAVAQFMDDGGGVFATGDHEDLGVAMCGSVPRVRNMRKCHWPGPGPNGEPVAPPVGGPDRYDTLGPGGSPGVQFNDQSDDVPQVIRPRLYQSWLWNKWFHRAYPHPLLCGPRGVIRVLPDHPHEGECYVPSNLTATFTFDGYSTTEYPGGLAPEVIAWSSVAARTQDAHKGVLNSRSFGAIGAYDGHGVDVGRVVVDATWHHFFNINLIGELGNPDPVKSVGFSASASGAAAFEDIKSYYRNIAVWLARPSSQSCMWWRAVWWTRWNHQLVMDVGRVKFAEATISDVLFIGGEARDVLGRYASQCNVRRWISWYVIRPRLPQFWETWQRYLDVWAPRSRPSAKRGPDVVVPVAVEMMVDAVLGALVMGLADVFPEQEDGVREKAEEVDFDELLGRYVEHAANLLSEHLERTGAELRRAGAALKSDG